jgi:P27 family predicted phage terminase small subunit
MPALTTRVAAASATPRHPPSGTPRAAQQPAQAAEKTEDIRNDRSQQTFTPLQQTFAGRKWPRQDPPQTKPQARMVTTHHGHHAFTQVKGMFCGGVQIPPAFKISRPGYRDHFDTGTARSGNPQQRPQQTVQVPSKQCKSQQTIPKEEVMGVRGSGRKPRPNHLKALEGVRESRINREEPIPSEAAIVPPVELPEAAQAIWNRLAPDLIARRVLTAWDCDSFSVYCRAVALFNENAAVVEAEGAATDRPYKGSVASPAFRAMVAAEKMMTSIGARFGLSPADRARIQVDHNLGPKSGPESYLR